MCVCVCVFFQARARPIGLFERVTNPFLEMEVYVRATKSHVSLNSACIVYQFLAAPGIGILGSYHFLGTWLGVSGIEHQGVL